MPLVARCLALQWCAESSGAEISAATRRYQRETSFVNSSPTVSRLHSWLTALCVTLPCLHAVSKALVLPSASVPASPPSPCSSSALITAHCGSLCHQRYIRADLCLPVRLCTHEGKHVTSDPLALGGHYSTLLFNPFSDSYPFMPLHYTDPFIPITHAAFQPKPLIL